MFTLGAAKRRLFSQVSNIAKRNALRDDNVLHSAKTILTIRPDVWMQKSWLSTVKALSSNNQPIKILYASQTGTAKLFAHLLNEELASKYPDRELSISEWKDAAPEELLEPKKALHVFLTSVAGVGEPPDNGREFYNWIMSKSDSSLSGLEYAVFGLGSSAGHAAYYNVIGKSLDKRLEELGASRVLEIGLGDDGDCIEDDFDSWMEGFVNLLKEKTPDDGESRDVGVEDVIDDEAGKMDVVQQREQLQLHQIRHGSESSEMKERLEEAKVKCPGVALSDDEMRMTSNKFPSLKLRPRESELVRKHLFHLNESPDQFYADGTVRFDVIGNKLLGVDAGETGIHELKLANPQMTYETGDHLVVYPQNSQCIVEAYLDMLDVDRHAIIAEDGQPITYQYPKGLTVYETMTHCVDLGALPSPSFARMITGRKDIDYKAEVAYPRRTALDLILQYDRRLSLEDLLFQVAPMKPRYYSIASSNIKHPNEIRLVYRRVKYVSKLGMLREGICTNYLSHKGYLGTGKYAHIAAYVNTNATFRLPKSTETPLLFIAGGCGVAPIRGLVEERVALAQSGKLGPATLYIGFRSPDDEVYRQRFEEAIHVGALTDAHMTYSSGSSDKSVVSDAVLQHGDRVWKHFEDGGVTFLCGGARAFGAAVESAFLNIVQEHGKKDFVAAEQYLRTMIKNGRLMNDLAD
eukprot:CCRYP_009675-RA/>CCRYP_009675-RA protein AED:0.30 eAED:0.30 QI:244/1/1/1/1/1/6/966/690